MTSPKINTEVPRIALTIPEAAAALGLGTTFFDAEVRPELRLIRRKSKVLVPVAELERWTAEHAEQVLPEERGR